MTFWIIAIAVSLAAAGFIVRPLLRREGVAAPRAAHDAQIFRDQLKELSRDVARGVVSEVDAETTRLEISRRLLAADEEIRATGGAAPVLSRRLREKIESLLPARLGELVSFVKDRRPRIADRIALRDRRGFYERLLSSPISEAVLDGDMKSAEAGFEAALDAVRAAFGARA